MPHYKTKVSFEVLSVNPIEQIEFNDFLYLLRHRGFATGPLTVELVKQDNEIDDALSEKWLIFEEKFKKLTPRPGVLVPPSAEMGIKT